MEDEIKPVLNLEEIQKKANEYAMKGAIECVKEYYTGYQSPFKKIIEGELEKQKLSWPLHLPDILAQINESLSKEIDQIANQAVAKSFIPLATRFLTRVEKEIKFSDILKEFQERYLDGSSSLSFDDFCVEIKRDTQYGWINVKISCEDDTYNLTLHKVYGSLDKYQILSLPNISDEYRRTMKVSLDNVTLELPFTPDVLKDDFLSYIARVIIAKSEIILDCEEFDESWFERDDF